MPFTGKATYSAGSDLPEAVEDVSDLVSIASPTETPLLDALGDGARPARSTVHEWLEDALLADIDALTDDAIANPTLQTVLHVVTPGLYRPGDQLRAGNSEERMRVESVDAVAGTITVHRGHAGGTEALAPSMSIRLLGNAALEGADADAARFTTRTRRFNHTQILSASVEVSGSELAVRQIGLADEMDHQKNQRLRELMRDLESTVINGRSELGDPGAGGIRRMMNGLLALIDANVFRPGVDGFPAGSQLTEDQLNTALREVWTTSGGRIDLIVVGGRVKRAINSFIGTAQRFHSPRDGVFHDGVGIYESDFGVCRVVMCRAVPPGTVLLLDSSRVAVMPLAGRSFHFKPLAATGDRESGQIIGEYTLELRNAIAHAVIKGLTV